MKAVEDVGKLGRRCILDIDSQVRVCLSWFKPVMYEIVSHVSQLHPQGVRLIKQNHPSLNPVFVFISPPSLSVLRSRLVGRGTETDEAVKARLETALKEIAYVKGEPEAVDTIIINDDLDRAYSLLEQLALGEPIKGDALPSLDDE